MHRRTATVVVARQTRQYETGERVRILRGHLIGRILTVRDCANDWVVLKETRSREVMSKGNVEPEAGFTEEEMTQAKRIAERMWRTGSLV